ncbi:MAG: SusF/SusE family outer membrane protein, partial [Bacteroidota bacterium]
MKKIIYLILIVFTTGFLASCEKEDNNPVIDTNDVTAPALTLDFDELVLLEDNAEDTITFEWSPAQYSLNNITEPTYRLQYKHVDSSDFRQLTNTRATTFKISVAELNTEIKKAGLEPGVAADVEMRVKAELVGNDEATKVSSDIAQTSVTAYEAEVAEAAKLWVPGAYQGWAPEEAPNVYSPADDGEYNGYIHFPEDSESLEFKFTSAPDWEDTNYGLTEGEEGVLNTDPGAGNLEVEETGTWYMTVNTDELTWESELRNFALVGSFTGWGDDPDIPLEFDADEQVFTATVDLEAGDEFKWRANSAWDTDLGLDENDETVLAYGGANLTVEEDGNYTIILDLYAEVP